MILNFFNFFFKSRYFAQKGRATALKCNIFKNPLAAQTGKLPNLEETMSKLLDKFGIKIKKGDYVFKEGDPADSCFMVHSGKIEICKTIRSTKKQINILQETDFFGEMAIINSLPRMADAIALVDSELLQMNKESFIDTIKHNHHFSINVFQLLSNRLRDSTEVNTRLAGKENEQTVFTEILYQALKTGKKDQKEEWILISQDKFSENFTREFDWDSEKFQKILGKITLQQKITQKKDKNGSGWIALRL